MIKLDNPGQIAMVVKDVESATRFLHQKFGIGPFGLMELKAGKAEYKGNTVNFHIKVGLCKHCDMIFEVIEHVSGDIILADPDYLPPGGQGVHHVGFFVEDAEAMASEFLKEGGRVLQRSWAAPGLLTIYLETATRAGMLIELIQTGKPRNE